MSKMHTLAFQIDDDMYIAIKGYLDQYKLITNRKIVSNYKQKEEICRDL